MKILVYAHLFPPGLGGMGFSSLEIVRGLNNLGHTLEVIACTYKGASEFVAGLEFPVKLVPKWPFATQESLVCMGLLNWTFVPWYFLTVKKKIKMFRPDVILVADETANCFWGVWSRRIAVPYVSYCSVPFITLSIKIRRFNLLRKIKYNLKHAMRNRLKSSLLSSYEHAILIMAVSNSTKAELCGLGRDIRKKIHIVPRSVDDEFFDAPVTDRAIDMLKAKHGISDEHFVLLSVANLILDKGVDDVIKALSGLSKPVLSKVKYIIVGKGPAENYLKQQARELNLADNVIFAGRVRHTELIPYYDICHLFILPSRKGKGESFGRVFIEAAARSKPSIGVSDGGMVDAIEDRKTGFLVSPGDVEGIRQKIMYLMFDLKKAKELGETARLRAEMMYTSRIVARQLEEHLKNAAAQHN